MPMWVSFSRNMCCTRRRSPEQLTIFDLFQRKCGECKKFAPDSLSPSTMISRSLKRHAGHFVAKFFPWSAIISDTISTPVHSRRLDAPRQSAASRSYNRKARPTSSRGTGRAPSWRCQLRSVACRSRVGTSHLHRLTTECSFSITCRNFSNPQVVNGWFFPPLQTPLSAIWWKLSLAVGATREHGWTFTWAGSWWKWRSPSTSAEMWCSRVWCVEVLLNVCWRG